MKKLHFLKNLYLWIVIERIGKSRNSKIWGKKNEKKKLKKILKKKYKKKILKKKLKNKFEAPHTQVRGPWISQKKWKINQIWTFWKKKSFLKIRPKLQIHPRHNFSIVATVILVPLDFLLIFPCPQRFCP